MCYSAEIQADYKTLVCEFDAIMDYDAFASLWLRQNGSERRPKMPKAFEDAFAEWTNKQEHEIWKAIHANRGDDLLTWEIELFNQQRRVADAERELANKPTKTARTALERASSKKAQVEGWLADLRRSEHDSRDFRIFPGWWAPVVVSENGQRVIRPMRYQCRPPEVPVSHDKDYPGTYNARRDNLERAWKDLFGYRHGLIVVDRFYENVEGPDCKNVVVQFRPRDSSPMLVACLWSHWEDPQGIEPDLYSFAAITDEPEPEVAKAGHDRTIINIRPEHVEAWLNPDPGDLASIYAIFDDKQHPYYEHRAVA